MLTGDITILVDGYIVLLRHINCHDPKKHEHSLMKNSLEVTMIWRLLVLFSCTLTAISAQQARSIDSKVSDVLSRMSSKDLSTRERAFDEMMELVSKEQDSTTESGSVSAFDKFFTRHPEQSDSVKLGLIQLLASSNDLFVTGKNATPKTYTEGNSEHYARLIEAVASLEDERTIPVLVGAMTTGGIARRGLLKYGDKALGPVTEQLNNPDPLVRASALGLSVNLLKGGNDAASRKRVLELLRSALADPASVVRSHAIREIGCLDERQEFIPILEKMSKDDPEKFPRKAPDGTKAADFYPVRYDAQRVLRDIQNNKTCKVGG